jgi:hypothetical protein
VTVTLHRRLKAVGAALAASGHIRLPEGPAADWNDKEVARVGVLVDICGWELLARLDNEALVVLSTERGSGASTE